MPKMTFDNHEETRILRQLHQVRGANGRRIAARIRDAGQEVTRALQRGNVPDAHTAIESAWHDMQELERLQDRLEAAIEAFNNTAER